MIQDRDYPRIPYEERRAIGKLLDAHVAEYGDRLRAVVAFGDLVTLGRTFDIDLLEVVESWDGARDGRVGFFRSTSELPLRGELRLYFLSPEEFENPGVVPDEADRRWIEELLERVTRGFEVVLQIPPGYARRALERSHALSTLTSPPSGSVRSRDPLRPQAKP
jgi:hypothetical protein